MKKDKYYVIVWDGRKVLYFTSASRNVRKYIWEYDAEEVSVYLNDGSDSPVSYARMRIIDGARVLMVGAVKQK